MRILMRMPTKNVYVSESDLPLFDRAAELAGGMSAAVALGLRLYVAQQDGQRKDAEMRTIELKVDDGAVVGVKRFSGRQILRWSRQEGLRSRTARVYATARGQYAVYLREDPNWVVLSGSDDDNPIWDDPALGRGEWWHRGPRELKVFATIEEMAGELPDELVAAVRDAGTRPAVEDLDI